MHTAASTLDQKRCPIIHLTGEAYIFSLYEVGEFVSDILKLLLVCSDQQIQLLAFYTESSAGAFSSLDRLDDDEKEISEVVADLRLMLQNIIVRNAI